MTKGFALSCCVFNLSKAAGAKGKGRGREREGRAVTLGPAKKT